MFILYNGLYDNLIKFTALPTMAEKAEAKAKAKAKAESDEPLFCPLMAKNRDTIVQLCSTVRDTRVMEQELAKRVRGLSQAIGGCRKQIHAHGTLQDLASSLSTVFPESLGYDTTRLIQQTNAFCDQVPYTQLTDTLARLENDHSMDLFRIGRCEATRATASRRLASDDLYCVPKGSTFRPFDMLPDELVGLVLEFIDDDNMFTSTPWLVCRRWKIVVHRNPVLQRRLGNARWAAIQNGNLSTTHFPVVGKGELLDVILYQSKAHFLYMREGVYYIDVYTLSTRATLTSTFALPSTPGMTRLLCGANNFIFAYNVNKRCIFKIDTRPDADHRYYHHVVHVPKSILSIHTMAYSPSTPDKLYIVAKFRTTRNKEDHTFAIISCGSPQSPSIQVYAHSIYNVMCVDGYIFLQTDTCIAAYTSEMAKPVFLVDTPKMRRMSPMTYTPRSRCLAYVNPNTDKLVRTTIKDDAKNVVHSIPMGRGYDRIGLVQCSSGFYYTFSSDGWGNKVLIRI